MNKSINKRNSCILTSVLCTLLSVLFISCEHVEDSVSPTDSDLCIVVGNFPAFGESVQTRASNIGTPDAGKTQWEENDEIIITVKSEKYGTQYATLTYDGKEWCFDYYPKYLEGENEDDGSLEITALYAPCYEVKDDVISLKDGKEAGMDEYIEVKCYMDYGVLNIPFSQAERNYSRIRIVCPADVDIFVYLNYYTPAGYEKEQPYWSFKIDNVDENGNAYVYGIFSEGGYIAVLDYNTEDYLSEYEFTRATEPGKSYALDARPKDGKTIVFVDGVSRESGWYDVNKVGKGDNGDINMCWAASASNIIQWWQDRYVAAGENLPAQAVTGSGSTYELALMEMFHQQWNNDRGGHVAEAVPWYFEGVNYGVTASPGSQAYPLSGNYGGYFKEVWDDIYPCLYHEYTYMLGMYTNLYVGEFNNYYLWGDGSGLMGEERLRYFTRLVTEFVDRGIASLTVSLSPNLQTLHHATTIWGYEIDNATGLLTRLWITDSDDLEKEPKLALLNEYEVSVGDGYSHIKLSSNDVRYGACYAVALTPVSGYRK